MMKLGTGSKQTLLHLVKKEISYSEYMMNMYNSEIKYQYDLSDKNSEEGKFAFECLNSLRNDKRKLKTKINKLARIAKELKSEINTNNNGNVMDNNQGEFYYTYKGEQYVFKYFKRIDDSNQIEAIWNNHKFNLDKEKYEICDGNEFTYKLEKFIGIV